LAIKLARATTACAAARLAQHPAVTLGTRSIKRGVIKEAAAEGVTAGLGGIFGKFDDVNDLRKASQVHHLATNQGKWADEFAKLFARAGVSMDDAVNKMKLPGHMGRHTNTYHEFVYERLSTAIGNTRGATARSALEDALQQIRRELERNPRLPYRDGGL
jgi:hypothetical protein